MQEKIMQVFYGNDRLPYKDKAREVHYPNVGNIITGENNTTLIRFYVDKIGGISNVSWCANIKTPSGRVFWRLLDETKATDEIGEYVELSISDLYSNEIGKTFISLNGFFGNVEITMNDDEDYEVNGTPDILATGCILVMVNYTPQALYNESLDPSVVQQLIGALGNKLDIYGNMSITKYDSLASAEADLSKIVNGQVVLVKVGDYYQYKIKSGGSLTDIATQQASQITIGGIYESFGDLPSPSEETSGKIYLVRATTKTSDNIYNEYITIYDSETYQWEQAGVNADDLYPSFSILRALPTVNINGKQLGNQWTAPFTSGDNPYFTIKYNNANITKESAIGWLRFATGIETLPTFDLNSPKQVYILFIADQDYGTLIRKGNPVLCKAQWEQGADEYGQLKLYVVNTFSELGELKITNGSGGIKITTNNGHDVEFYNMETNIKFAIYRCNTNTLLLLQDTVPHPNNTISLGTEDKAFKEIVSKKVKSAFETRKSASNYCLRIETQSNNNTTFRVVLNPDTANEYVVPSFMVNVAGDLLPLVHNQRKLGDMGIEWKEVWTPTLKTKDGAIIHEKSVKNLMTSDDTYTKEEVDSLIEALTGVTHKYQHNVVIGKNDEELALDFEIRASITNEVSTSEINSQPDILTFNSSGYFGVSGWYQDTPASDKLPVYAVSVQTFAPARLKIYTIGGDGVYNVALTKTVLTNDNVYQIY